MCLLSKVRRYGLDRTVSCDRVANKTSPMRSVAESFAKQTVSVASPARSAPRRRRGKSRRTAALSTVSLQNCLQLKAVLWAVIEKMQKTLVKRLALRAGDAADAGCKTVNYRDVSAKAAPKPRCSLFLCDT